MMKKEEVMKMKEDLRKESILDLEKKMKVFGSKKCRMKKIEYNVKDMEKLLEEERICREVIIEKKEKKVYIYERSEEDIKNMNIEEVMKGIKNIDSLMCIEKGMREEVINYEKLEKCKKVRGWLVERKKIVSGSELGKINVSDLLRKLEDLESVEDVRNWILEREESKK